MKKMVLALALLLCFTPRVEAQSLQQDLTNLFIFGSCGEVLCLVAGSGHGNHFVPATVKGNGTLLNLLGNSIAASASDVPLSATTSGISYSFVRGLPVQTTTSPGPIFGERAATLGKGRLMFGANVSVLKYTSLRGVGLDSVAFTFTHEDEAPLGVLGDPPFEKDLINVNLNLDLSAVIGTLIMTYGLSDNIDFGIALPFVHTSLSGESHAQIVTSISPPVHYFAGTSANPVLSAVASSSGSSTGLGDVALRLKARLFGDPDKTAAAFLADVRLGTGSVTDFQGTGGTDIRLSAIGSTRMGNFAPHVNAGVALRSGSNQTNALLGTAGFDQVLTPRATLAIDVISEFQMGTSKIVVPDPVDVAGTFIPVTNIPNKKTDIVGAAIGAKLTNGRGLTGLANVIIPILNNALKPNAILTFGVEYVP